MANHIRRCFTVIVVVCCLAFAAAAQAQDDKSQAMRRHLVNAVKAFDNEQYDRAAEEFEEMLKLSPNSSDALALRDLATVRFYVKAMTSGPSKLRDSVLRLLELAAEAERARFTDEDEIEKRIERLAGTFEERSRIYIDLMSAGRYAVPPLVKRLYDVKADGYPVFHLYASLALIRIGEEAVLPLCTALRTDLVPLRQDICFILGQIGDPRSAPYLLQAAKADPDESVQAVAAEALEKIRAYADIPDDPPHVALLRYARLYYYRDPSVQRSSKYGHAVWNWSTEENRLVMQTVPPFLYNISMARQVAAQALLAAPDYEPALPLLISTYQKETVLIEQRLQQSKTDPAAKLSELEERGLMARLQKSRNVLLTLRSAGERHFYRALALELRDGDFEAAVATINDLAELASPDLNTYQVLPALSEPLRAAVITIRSPEERRAPVGPAAAKLEAAPVTRPRVTASSLFQARVAAELGRLEAAAPKKPETIKRAPPAERETLNYLIATARRVAAATEAKKVAEEPGQDQPEGLATSANPLLLALQNTNKSVRYTAAAAVVRIRPVRQFATAKTVVKILGQALTERGVSAALIVSTDNQATNLLREIVRKAGHVPYSASSVQMALTAARALPPKDAVIVQDSMNEAFKALRSDPVIAAVPFIIFTKAENTDAAKQLYAADGVPVISLEDKADNVRAAVLDTMAAGHLTRKKSGLAAQYARTGAEAIAAIPAAGSPLSPHLAAIKPALIAALDSDNPAVRISAIGGLGKAKVTSLAPRLIGLARAEDRSKDERLACIAAIGAMMEPGKETPAEVVELIESIHRSADADFRLDAIQRLRGAAIPAADLEKIINRQEAAELGAAATAAPAAKDEAKDAGSNAKEYVEPKVESDAEAEKW
ncbi:MAG: HEAT repeat domain-containing protein [Planctomycetota bacterium]